MHLASRTHRCWETAQRTGLLHRKTLTSAMQHSVHKKTMTLVMCTDTYAASISDNDLTADCGVLDMIQDKGATVHKVLKTFQ